MITEQDDALRFKDETLNNIYEQITKQAACANYNESLDCQLHSLKNKQAEKFIHYNLQLAENGDPLACFCLAYVYFYGKHRWVDQATAIFWLRKAADQKFGDSRLVLGYFCMKVEIAAKKGDPNAQYAYADALYHGMTTTTGYTVDANPFNANYWLSMAAEQGNIRARMRLAEWHLMNNLQTKAFYHYKIAADAGNADAQNFVGVQYREGGLVEYNHELAFKYFKRASDQGHADAECNLACFYFAGIATKPNYKRALNLFKKSFDKGCARSLLFIGIMHHRGLGVEKNIVTAHALILEAFYMMDAQDPHYRATEDTLTMVEKEMTPEERQKSVKLRADCHAFAK